MNTQLLFFLKSNPAWSYLLLGIVLGAAITIIYQKYYPRPHKNKGTISQLVKYNEDCKKYFSNL